MNTVIHQTKGTLPSHSPNTTNKMSSFTDCALDTMPFSMSLAHTRNSRGDFGMFVNPSTCPCVTCRTYMAEEAERSPTPTLSLAPDANDDEGSRVPTSTPRVVPTSTPTPTIAPAPPASLSLRPFASSFPPPAPSLIRVNAYSDALGRTQADEDASLMVRLRMLRDRLMREQEEVHSGEYRSHDEMAAEDALWNDLDQKITAIEEVLQLFRAMPSLR